MDRSLKIFAADGHFFTEIDAIAEVDDGLMALMDFVDGRRRKQP